LIFNFNLRRYNAVDTGTVDAAVPGGAQRLLAAPRLRDFLVNMDFTTQKWQVLYTRPIPSST